MVNAPIIHLDNSRHPGQALGSSLGLELELDQFNLSFDWQELEKSVRSLIRVLWGAESI